MVYITAGGFSRLNHLRYGPLPLGTGFATGLTGGLGGGDCL